MSATSDPHGTADGAAHLIMNLVNSSFSKRLSNLRSSPIRQILSVLNAPGMISFSGGLPCAETFPELRLDTVPTSCLQYGASDGDAALRECIAYDLCEMGLACKPDQVLILSGSQQGLDLVAKLFIDFSTPVAVESPTYLGALDVFRFYGARFQALQSSEPGRAWEAEGLPRFVYTIPTFQNPTGRCYSRAERDALAAACDEHSVPLYEDDPYRELVYDPCDRSPICGRIKRAPWIYQGSFSKSIAPGLRLGFLAASTNLIAHLSRLKESADLQSSRISQWLVLEQLRSVDRIDRMRSVVEIYRRKRDHFAQVLDHYLGSVATWQVPPGGFFFWLTLRDMLDTSALLSEGIRRGVAFMPGEPFFPNAPAICRSLRLSFSLATESQTERGLEMLGMLLEGALAQAVH